VYLLFGRYFSDSQLLSNYLHFTNATYLFSLIGLHPSLFVQDHLHNNLQDILQHIEVLHESLYIQYIYLERYNRNLLLQVHFDDLHLLKRRLLIRNRQRQKYHQRLPILHPLHKLHCLGILVHKRHSNNKFSLVFII